MDLLRTAVVDIATLVAAGHALVSSPIGGGPPMQPKLRYRLRREIKRATVAYIDAFARSEREVVDDALLAGCRVAAEQQMLRAIEYQGVLSRIMASEPGSLDGLAAARQDLWRLAHMAICLRMGVATLREPGASVDVKSANALARRLRRRYRNALIAYARVILRTKEPRGQQILTARQAALAEIGKRGAADAQRLSDVEAGGDPNHTVIQRGVTRPLFDLALDWQRHPSEPN